MEQSFLHIFIVILTLLPGMSSGSSCNNGYVQCSEGDKCIHVKYVCDGTQHCTDGSDEDPDLCSFWSTGSCRRDKIQCNNNCYSTWDACSYGYCPSEITSGEMCKIVINKELPPPYNGLKLASKLRKRRQAWTPTRFIGSRLLYDDDEDLIESFPDTRILDVETVNMLAKAVKSEISESECPMLYIRVGNHCASFFSLAQVPWPEARQFCRSINGDLLTIKNIHMYAGLQDYFRETGLTCDFWLGGRYDMDLNNWGWVDDTPMPSSSPYWALKYSSSCQSRSPGGKCFNYVQLPEQHTQGYCAAITYENYFYISDENCSLRKSPLCLIDTKTLNQVKIA